MIVASGPEFFHVNGGASMIIESKGFMEDQRLLASAALFRQLHDNKKDIYDVLRQFICSTIVNHQLWTFDVTKISIHLNKDFGFEIPEAVVKTCLRKRMKRENLLSFSGGNYAVTEIFDIKNDLNKDYDEVKSEQDIITNALIDYVGQELGEELTPSKKQELLNDFYAYFIPEKKVNTNSVIISKFIVKHSKDSFYTEKLNKVEEGLILYSGICFSPDLVNVESWKNDFQLILDTEVLFDAVGLNGDIHERIFSEFHSLVFELSQRSVGKSKIEMRFLEETKREIDDFFYAAEKIMERRQQPEPSKLGMMRVLNSCATISDVVTRKSQFYDKLKKLKIKLDEDKNYYDNPTYNIESLEVLEDFKNEFPEVDESKIADVLKIFTKINHKRQGNSSKGLEQSGALLITGKNVTKSIAFSIAKKAKGITPFASDLEFITERLWFKLNKGFGGGGKIPTAFDVVARAQVILSTQVGNKITADFKALKEEVNNGTLSVEMASTIVSELRARNYKPEDFVSESIDEKLSFMQEDIIDKALRNKSLLESKVQEGIEIKSKLEALTKKFEDINEQRNTLIEESNEKIAKLKSSFIESGRKDAIAKRKKENLSIKRSVKIRYRFFYSLYVLVVLFLGGVGVCFFRNPSDTTLTIMSLFVSMIPIVTGLLGNKYIKRKLNKLVLKRFRKLIERRNIRIPIQRVFVGDADLV